MVGAGKLPLPRCKCSTRKPLQLLLCPPYKKLPSHAAAPSNVSAAVLRALTSRRFHSAAASFQQRGYGRGGIQSQAIGGVSGLWGFCVALCG